MCVCSYTQFYITHLSKFLVCLTKHRHLTNLVQEVIPTTGVDYHCIITSLVCLTHANIQESMGKAVFFTVSHARIRISTTSHVNPYQVLQVMRTASDNTDGRKLVIFFGIALHHGDTCLV